MPELAALVKAVEQNNELMAEVENDLTDLKTEIMNLPKKYLPRDEAQEKADTVRTIAIAVVGGILSLLVVAAGFTLYVKREGIHACRDDRQALREVVEIALADRQPLPTSTPETVAAIQQQNVNSIRPLRERLLSLEGTQPEKC